MDKKIVIIYGHPLEDSYCTQLADAYAKGALDCGAEIRKLELSKMDFDPVLRYGYKKRMVEESDLIWSKESIVWADHIVFAYPVWWGTMPSLLKGFVDRVFTPGYAFNYVKGSRFNEKLLKGKTARVIVTSDAPSWYIGLIWKGITKIQIKQTILNYCGVSPVKYTHYGSVKWQDSVKLNQWMEKTYQFGYRLS